MATIAIWQYVRRKHLELPVLIAVAVVGAAIGFGVLSLNGLARKEYLLPRKRWEGVLHLSHSEGYVFKHLGEFRMWLFLIAAQTARWAIGAAFLLAPEMRRPLKGLWSKGRVAVAASVTATAIPLVAVVVVGSLYSRIHYPVPWHQWKVLALSLIGTCVALLGVAELALVKFALQDDPPAGGTLADIERFLALRTLLQRVLAIEGAIIGAAVLTTGALRNAVVAYNAVLSHYPGVTEKHHQTLSPFPREYVLIYGAFFTLLLAVLYAPVYFRLLDVGRANVDAACKAEEPASAIWLPVYEKRKKLEEHLQLQMATSASFRAGVAILTPLGGALVALLLGAA